MSEAPALRRNLDNRPKNLIVICHGWFQAPEFTLVRGVDQARFWVKETHTADPVEISDQLSNFKLKEWSKDQGEWVNRAGRVVNYTLSKSENASDKKKALKDPDDRYLWVDKTYIESIMNREQKRYDILGIHNTLFRSRNVRFEQIFDELQKIDGIYTKLLCAFCREQK